MPLQQHPLFFVSQSHWDGIISLDSSLFPRLFCHQYTINEPGRLFVTPIFFILIESHSSTSNVVKNFNHNYQGQLYVGLVDVAHRCIIQSRHTKIPVTYLYTSTNVTYDWDFPNKMSYIWDWWIIFPTSFTISDQRLGSSKNGHRMDFSSEHSGQDVLKLLCHLINSCFENSWSLLQANEYLITALCLYPLNGLNKHSSSIVKSVVELFLSNDTTTLLQCRQALHLLKYRRQVHIDSEKISIWLKLLPKGCLPISNILINVFLKIKKFLVKTSINDGTDKTTMGSLAFRHTLFQEVCQTWDSIISSEASMNHTGSSSLFSWVPLQEMLWNEVYTILFQNTTAENLCSGYKHLNGLAPSSLTKTDTPTATLNDISSVVTTPPSPSFIKQLQQNFLYILSFFRTIITCHTNTLLLKSSIVPSSFMLSFEVLAELTFRMVLDRWPLTYLSSLLKLMCEACILSLHYSYAIFATSIPAAIIVSCVASPYLTLDVFLSEDQELAISCEKHVVSLHSKINTKPTTCDSHIVSNSPSESILSIESCHTLRHSNIKLAPSAPSILKQPLLTPPSSKSRLISKPSIPKLNLLGLAPPLGGYGVVAPGESPAATTTSQYRRHRIQTYGKGVSIPIITRSVDDTSISAASSYRSTPESSRNRLFPSYAVALESSRSSVSRDTTTFDDRRGYETHLAISATFLLGILSQLSDETLIYIEFPYIRYYKTSQLFQEAINLIIKGGPAYLAIFVSQLLAKLPLNVISLTSNFTRLLLNADAFYLLKLLTPAVFSAPDSMSSLHTRIGTGTYSSVWVLPSDPTKAVKMVTFPVPSELRIWSYGDTFNRDNDNFNINELHLCSNDVFNNNTKNSEFLYPDVEYWARVFSNVWTEIRCIKALETTNPPASCQLFDVGLLFSSTDILNSTSFPSPLPIIEDSFIKNHDNYCYDGDADDDDVTITNIENIIKLDHSNNNASESPKKYVYGRDDKNITSLLRTSSINVTHQNKFHPLHYSTFRDHHHFEIPGTKFIKKKPLLSSSLCRNNSSPEIIALDDKHSKINEFSSINTIYKMANTSSEKLFLNNNLTILTNPSGDEVNPTTTLASMTCWIIVNRYSQSLHQWRLAQIQYFIKNLQHTDSHTKMGLHILKIFMTLFYHILLIFQIMHKKGIVHFDIKCHNVLITTEDNNFYNNNNNNKTLHHQDYFTTTPFFKLTLCDFGEAMYKKPSLNSATWLKNVNEPSQRIAVTLEWAMQPSQRDRGTELNKSPEILLIHTTASNQCSINDDTTTAVISTKVLPTGSAADVWGLGCLLFELLTGQFLFATDYINDDDDYSDDVYSNAITTTTTDNNLCYNHQQQHTTAPRLGHISPQATKLNPNNDKVLINKTKGRKHHSDLKTTTPGDLWWCVLFLRLSGKTQLIPNRAVVLLRKVITTLLGHTNPQIESIVDEILRFLKFCLILDPAKRPSVTELMSYFQKTRILSSLLLKINPRDYCR